MTVSTLAPRARRRMQPPPPADPVTRYALDVLAGRILACRYVHKACERHLSDLATGAERGLHFDAAEAQRSIDFYHLLHHYKGREDRITLEPWQQFVVGSAFGWKRADGTRRFRIVYVEVASKNGKSTMAGGAGLRLAFFDGEPGAEVYAAATKRDQAKIPWNAAVAMVRKSPGLHARIQINAGSLSQTATASFFQPLGRDSDSDQGINPNGAIIDELHVHDSRDLLDNIEKAASVRRQPMIWKITTAGVKRESVWWEERSDAIAVLEGRATDDSLFAAVYTLDEGDDPFDESVWVKANPNLDVSVRRDFLRERSAKAQRSPGALAGFLRFHANVPTQQSTKAIDIEAWDGCTTRAPDEDYDAWVERVAPRGSLGYAALDLASVRDLTALVDVFRSGDRVAAVCRFWCPEDGIAERSRVDGVPYGDWVRDGWLIATPGNITDYAYVRREFTGTYLDDGKVAHDPACQADRWELRELGYDRWNATQLATEFTEDGAACIVVPQTFAGLGPGWRELERLILDHKLDHGGHPVLRWMAGNVEVETDGSGNQKPSKAKSSERIDGIAALDMAIGRLITHVSEDERSVYETEGRGLVEVG
jgi:phage terminase large subunit-like protein